MKYSLSTPCLVLSVIASVLVIGAAPASTDDAEFAETGQYASMSRDGLLRAMEGITTQLADRQTRLIRVLQTARSKQQIIAAIYLSGLNHVRRAAPTLARMIDFKDDNVGFADQLPLWGRNPALGALVEIGSPALQPLLDDLATSDVQNVRELSAKGLSQIYGNECAKFILREATEDKSLDGQKIARLKSALVLLK